MRNAETQNAETQNAETQNAETQNAETQNAETRKRILTKFPRSVPFCFDCLILHGAHFERKSGMENYKILIFNDIY